MAAVEPRLSILALRPLVAGLAAMGLARQSLLRAMGVSEAALQDPEIRVPMRAGVALFDFGVQQTGDANLGLHLAGSIDLDGFDVLFQAMSASATLGDALARASRYQRLVHDTSRVTLETTASGELVVRHEMMGGLPAPRQTAEFIVASWVRAGRDLTGTSWAPAEVRFAHAAPPDVAEHERVFAAPVRFRAGETAMRITARTRALPCVRADGALAAVLDRFASALAARVPASPSVADRVRDALVASMRGHDPLLAEVAATLRMSDRTLTRALASQGTSFRALRDAVRVQTASRLLADSRTSIAEVAFLLGFAEVGAFHRAFKRWTRLTPGAFRRQHAPHGD